MANTKNDRVVHELFRSIGERYDMRKLLKAASDSSLSVISEEELHQLLVEHQDQKMALCEGLKKLMVKDDGRLKKFAQFILTYNDPVQKNALATIQQHHRSRSSSGSNTPPSPMDVDSKDADISLSSLAQASDHDVGYATATDTCTGPSSKDISQGGILLYNERLLEPPTQAGSMLPLQMVQKTKGQSTESDTYTYEERLSQPAVEEYQTADAWPPMQEHGYAYYSDCLAQDMYPLQYQSGTDIKNKSARPTTDGWPPRLKENYKVILQNLNLNELLPHLVENGLVTQRESQEIDRDKGVPLTQNQHFLLYVLSQKGRDGFDIFIKCLKAEKEHLGHHDLVKILCNKKK